MGDQVEFGVLGPLEVRVDGQPVAISGRRQRALLTALVVRRDTVVPLDRLVDEVFGETPPEEARNALQTYVARLRQALGSAADIVVTRAPGYLLDASGLTVDADRFTEAVAAARQRQSPAAAVALLEDALALWRGEAYAEFRDTLARSEARQLHELRLAAREERAALLLQLGRVSEATAALDGLVADEPWRERTVELLVTALARDGRIADALAAYSRYRDALRDDLGLDPSPGLRRLEEQVLRGEVGPPVGMPLARMRHPLPTRATSFVGREREVAQLRELLTTPGRLVTLVGPGGVGKTRLAYEATAEEECAWTDLAALRDGDAVPRAVADGIGLDVQPGTTLLDTLRGWARSAEGLLVLDNCEHLLPPTGSLVEELLAAPTALRLLATSRERLGVVGEQLLVVPPLDVPEPGAADALSPAVQLFLDRAHAADPSLAADSSLLEGVGGICRALDGLPLAIELAAARVGTLTVDDLADRLDARFGLLRQPRRGGDPRHQTISTVVDWSFDLLTAEEQQLFLRLSAFAAAFDLAAAEAIAADDDLPAHGIPDLVARLAERSMLTRPGAAGVGQYRMLETLRSYAESRLSADEADRLRSRHAAFLVELAESAETGLHGPDELTWVRRIETWLDDLRAAWAWARDFGDTDIAVRLAAAMTWFGYWRLRPDLLAWGTWAVRTVPSHPRLAAAHAAAAHAAWFVGHMDQARELARRGVAVAGGPTAAAAAVPLYAVGDVALVSGDLTAAAEAYDRVAALAAVANDQAGFALGKANVAVTLAYGGDDRAAGIAREAVAAALASANPTATAFALFAEGEARADDDPDRASAALDEARQRAEGVGNPFIVGIVLTAAVALRGRRGPPDQAFALFRDAVEHWRLTGNRVLIVTTLRNLVILLARTGRDVAAVELAATLEHSSQAKSYGAEAERIATALSAARQRLGAAAYADAWDEGTDRTLEEAADQALRLLEENSDASHARI